MLSKLADMTVRRPLTAGSCSEGDIALFRETFEGETAAPLFPAESSGGDPGQQQRLPATAPIAKQHASLKEADRNNPSRRALTPVGNQVNTMQLKNFVSGHSPKMRSQAGRDADAKKNLSRVISKKNFASVTPTAQSRRLDTDTVAYLQQMIAELRGKVHQSEVGKINLVSAMEAEERCMLEALQKLDESRQTVQLQLKGALEKVQELENQNQLLVASHMQEQRNAAAALAAAEAAECRANGLLRDSQERARKADAAALRSQVQREKAELQARDEQVCCLQAQLDEMMRQMQELLDEMDDRKNAAKETEFELQEQHQKLVFQQERYQELTLRYERMEATLQATRAAFEESKYSRAKELEGKDDLRQQETQLLHTVLRAAEHTLQDEREKFKNDLAARSEEAKRESQIRKEVEARDIASRALARELERKIMVLEDQVETLRRSHEDASHALNENAQRLSQVLSEIEGWQRRVRNLNDHAREREDQLKKSRAEVVYLEGVLREACQFVTIHFKERMSSKKNPVTHVLATYNAHEPFLLERQNPDRSDALYMAKTIDQDFGKGHDNQHIMIEETGSIPYELVESKRQRGSGCAAREGSSDESKALRGRRQGPATPEAGKGMGQRGVREAKSTKGEISEDSSVGRKGGFVNRGVAEITGGERRGAEGLDYDASWSSAGLSGDGLSGDEANGVTNFASSLSNCANSRRDGQVDKKREIQVQWMKGKGGGDYEPANEQRSPLRCCSCVRLMLMLVPKMLPLCLLLPYSGIVLHFHVQIVLCAN